MSKESKPRDLWRQHFEAARDRPPEWCPSCGYNPPATGRHSADCVIAHPRPRGTPPSRAQAVLADIRARKTNR